MRTKKLMCLLTVLAIALSMLPVQALAADLPALADGNYVNWIDRIADLPDYAAGFYTWLEDNAAADGALVDPSNGTAMGTGYVHLVHTLEGTAQFQYTSGMDVSEQALNAALTHAGDEPQAVMEYIFDVYGAFDRDHPEVFWLNTESVCGMGIDYEYTRSGTTRSVNYQLKIYFYLLSEDYDVRMEGLRDASLIADAVETQAQDVQRILADCPTDGTVEEQIRYLNQALTHSNAYNSVVSGLTSGSADPAAWKSISALSGSAGAEGPVCEGYARAFKVLCDALEIPCVLTSGYARSTASGAAEQHMWNEVCLEGQWYAVDVTWNDPTVKSAPTETISGYEGEDWLLLGSQTEVAEDLLFGASHEIYNRVQSDGRCYTNGPVLAEQAYTASGERLDVSAYRNGEVYTAPEREGCVFAGWFTDAALTQPLGKTVTSGYAYPKFVEEGTLMLRYQVKSDATASSDQTDLRLLTSVDSLNYSNVTFVVTIQDQSVQLPCTTVYEKINAGGVKIENAAAVFGGDAKYFVTYTLLNIPQGMFETDITVTPSWQTLDGTVVCGTARTLRLSDSLN